MNPQYQQINVYEGDDAQPPKFGTVGTDYQLVRGGATAEQLQGQPR